MENNGLTLQVNQIVKGNAYTYHIERILGQGSFGITYLASTSITVPGPLGNIETEIKVAVKEFFMKDFNVRRDDGSLVEMTDGSLAQNYLKKFRKEAENLAKLSHPNIVNVLEVFEANNTCYYAMQYLAGGSLDAYVKSRGGLPEAEAVACIRQIGAAVQYMHDHRMLHLDLKPGNVMRSEDGQKMVLIDFGLSKQYGKDGNPESSTTIGLGTAGYAPIEQSKSDRDKEFAPTLDVYALGATFFKLLTATTPPDSSDVLDEGLPIDLLEDKGVIQTSIVAIERAMEPRKSKRVQSVTEFLGLLSAQSADEVTRIEGEPTVPITPQPKPAQNPQQPQRSHKSQQPQPTPQPRKPLPKWLWGVAAALMVACIVFFAIRSQPMTPEKMCQIGEQYYDGNDGKPQDYVQAVQWFRRAAEQGNARAQCNLGICYFWGQGVPQSYETAVEYYRKAAEQKHVRAQNNLGVCYAVAQGVLQNFETAVEWYRKSAEQGYPPAQCNLGMCYYRGHGVPQNYEIAVEWFRKAAEQGDARAQYILGVCYECGLGVSQSYETAVEWYRKAVEQGDAFARNSIGYIYEIGLGVSINYDLADWYPPAQTNLGNCYKNGQGVTQSYETAVEWYRKAAEQGLAVAQNNLGLCYEYGNGVEKNLETAKGWYLKAAKQDNENAIASCKRLGVSYE